MILVNTSNSNQKLVLREMAQEYSLAGPGAPGFWVDYVARVFYILANLSFAASINLYYKADFGDITLTTGWVGFRPRDAYALVYQAAARYRLGTDYDDVAARNGDDNYKTAEMLYKSMVMWDANLALNSYQHRDYSSMFGGSPSGPDLPPPNNNGYGGWNGDWTY